MAKRESSQPQILIIGASGFIGQHLLEHFESEKIEVRAVSRHSQNIISNADTTEKMMMELQEPTSVVNALRGIKTIYYLAHALGDAGNDLEALEMQQAHNLVSHLEETQKLIYLGAITPKEELSPHLKSRKHVGEYFAKAKCKTIEFKASIVVGKGSTSFEMIRALVTRLPFIVTTQWSESLCQPIAINDVVAYLAQAKDKKFRKKHLIVEIGGAQQLAYKELLLEYAKSQQLFRPELKVKYLPKSVAIEVMKIVIPEYYTVGKKLIGSIEAETTADNSFALENFTVVPLNYSQSISLAKDNELKEIKITEILRKLEKDSSIPQYLTGQTLQKVFSYDNVEQLEFILEKIDSKIPTRLKRFKKDEISFQLPMIGNIKLAINEEAKLLYLGYRPKFFFQATTWAAVDGLIKKFRLN